jgi:protocatechuate 3,4-dioxygenase beta subunit
MMCLPIGRSAMYLRAGRLFIALILITFVVPPTAAHWRTQKEQTREASGTIGGRVTIDDQPVRGVVVFLQATDLPFSQASKYSARTDQNGHFAITGVPAGTYVVQAFAPALVSLNENPSMSRQGRVVTLGDNEVVDGVNLALRAGGVITGRVYDADGKPLIQEMIRIFSIGEDNNKQPLYLPFSYMLSTDDRGEYRIFGIPAGKYLISIGVDTSNPVARSNAGSTYRQLTFHPDTTDQAKANFVEVVPGSEASGIDIVVGRPTKGYSATGRIIDATTGKPVAGLMYGYGSYDPQTNRLNNWGSSGTTSNARGEFRFDGITPGKYAAFALPNQDSELYSDIGNFTVTDSDVSGIVVKVQPGATITGNVIVERSDRSTGAPRLSDVRLVVFSPSQDAAPRGNQVRIAPDGSFRIIGLPRGVARFSLSYPAAKGLSIARIERDGVLQSDGIQINAGEEVSGVNIVLSYGTGTIRGQVEVEGAEITPTTVMFLGLRQTESKLPLNIGNQSPDLRGRFVIEGLSSGEYEIQLMVNQKPENGKPGFHKTIIQKVSVTNDAETRVILRVNPTTNDR